MTLRPLTVRCPACASADVTYTCEPKCCFNHLCGACYTTFELFTRPMGGTLTVEEMPSGERDSLAPTAACARCESLDVYVIEREDSSPNQLVCAACHALLELGFASVDSR
ncbi:MAG: hypothetical protein HYZ81_03580 [Nitrospinae bacterium]|nr:hypothetical protein [Nitrospinota bacterium]